LPHTSGPISKF